MPTISITPPRTEGSVSPPLTNNTAASPTALLDTLRNSDNSGGAVGFAGAMMVESGDFSPTVSMLIERKQRQRNGGAFDEDYMHNHSPSPTNHANVPRHRGGGAANTVFTRVAEAAGRLRRRRGAKSSKVRRRKASRIKAQFDVSSLSDPNALLQALELNPLWSQHFSPHHSPIRGKKGGVGGMGLISLSDSVGGGGGGGGAAAEFASASLINHHQTSNHHTHQSQYGVLVSSSVGYAFSSVEDALLDALLGTSGDGSYRHDVNRTTASNGDAMPMPSAGEVPGVLCGLVLTTTAILVVNFSAPAAAAEDGDDGSSSSSGSHDVDSDEDASPIAFYSESPAGVSGVPNLSDDAFVDDGDDDLDVRVPLNFGSPSPARAGTVDTDAASPPPPPRSDIGTPSPPPPPSESPPPPPSDSRSPPRRVALTKSKKKNNGGTRKKSTKNGNHNMNHSPMARLPRCDVVAEIPIEYLASLSVFANTDDALVKVRQSMMLADMYSSVRHGGGNRPTNADDDANIKKKDEDAFVAIELKSVNLDLYNANRVKYADDNTDHRGGKEDDEYFSGVGERVETSSDASSSSSSSSSATSDDDGSSSSSATSGSSGSGSTTPRYRHSPPPPLRTFEFSFVPISTKALDNPPVSETIAEFTEVIPNARLYFTVLSEEVIAKRQQEAAAAALEEAEAERMMSASVLRRSAASPNALPNPPPPQSLMADQSIVVHPPPSHPAHQSIGGGGSGSITSPFAFSLLTSPRRDDGAGSPTLSSGGDGSPLGLRNYRFDPESGKYKKVSDMAASAVLSPSSPENFSFLLSSPKSNGQGHGSSSASPGSPLGISAKLRSSRGFFDTYQRTIAGVGSSPLLSGLISPSSQKQQDQRAASPLTASVGAAAANTSSAAASPNDEAKHILASFHGGKTFALVTQSLKDAGLVTEEEVAATEGGAEEDESGGVVGLDFGGGGPHKAMAQITNVLIALQLQEQSLRSQYVEAASADFIRFVTTFWAHLNKMIQRSAQREVKAIRETHTNYAILSTDGAAIAGSPAARVQLPVSAPVVVGPDGHTPQLSVVSLNTTNAMASFQPQLFNTGVLKKPLNAEVTALIEQHEKSARQRMGKYFTHTNAEMLTRVRDTEWTIFTGAHKAQLEKFHRDVNMMKKHTAQLAIAMGKVNEKNKALAEELADVKGREEAVLVKARRREEALQSEVDKASAKAAALVLLLEQNGIAIPENMNAPPAAAAAAPSNDNSAPRRRNFSIFN